jgi:hypothetical protein
MRKRGAISMEMIVYAALALIVLVLLGYIFRQQIGSSAGSLFKIGKEAEEGARGERCVTMMTATSRKCSDKACETGWHEVYTSDKWKDCPDKKCCEKE